MDLLQYENRKIDVFDDKSLEADFNDDILFDDDDFKVSKYCFTILHLLILL